MIDAMRLVDPVIEYVADPPPDTESATVDYDLQMVLAYVPEVDCMSFSEALALAHERDSAAVEQLRRDCGR